MTDTLAVALVLIPCLIIAIVFHEVAHGYMAKLLGDETASERGRLTLNPIKHVDPIGTLLVPGALLLFGGPAFGWAKPVPVNKWRLDNPRYGMMAVAAAGPGSNFVLAAIGAVLFGLLTPLTATMAPSATGMLMVVGPDGSVQYLASGLFYFMLINVFLGLFNLLPIPPFDGSHIVGGLLPRSLRAQWDRLQQVGMFLLIAVIAGSWAFGTGWIERIVMPPVYWAMGYYLALAQFVGGG
ncbi:site-2 protease family protein [Erythrobacter sp. JK5]|uniref:site-2 protease family protein n=1 Tax=Erythrobacter sp. JK5 TaxID=2829500 RepID=UPI001BAABB5C|nr:site-2 protease family protein [Erythrobacter sp. JK5]QUL38109.1 site-2 protease family protein [Erythrobacter sp. JK5]